RRFFGECLCDAYAVKQTYICLQYKTAMIPLIILAYFQGKGSKRSAFRIVFLIYSIGCLLGKPGFRGYFFGVCFILSIHTMERSLSSFGNVSDWIDCIRPPIIAIDRSACVHSSGTREPFIAIKRPFSLTSGRQKPLKTDKHATARAMAISNVSRYVVV